MFKIDQLHCGSEGSLTLKKLWEQSWTGSVSLLLNLSHFLFKSDFTTLETLAQNKQAIPIKHWGKLLKSSPTEANLISTLSSQRDAGDGEGPRGKGFTPEKLGASARLCVRGLSPAHRHP